MSDLTGWNAILGSILADFGCQTGTIHRRNGADAELILVCQIGVPAELTDRISRIPFGKGIAGAAAARREPVNLCNLQQDLGGVARPDARKTGVAGSLAVPVFATGTTRVIGTLGIGTREPRDFSGEEQHRLQASAQEIAARFENKGFCDD